MKVRTYRCLECEYEREEYLQDTTPLPDVLPGEYCPVCNEPTALLWRVFEPKSNGQRWRHND